MRGTQDTIIPAALPACTPVTLSSVPKHSSSLLLPSPFPYPLLSLLLSLLFLYPLPPLPPSLTLLALFPPFSAPALTLPSAISRDIPPWLLPCLLHLKIITKHEIFLWNQRCDDREMGGLSPVAKYKAWSALEWRFIKKQETPEGSAECAKRWRCTRTWEVHRS